MSESMTFCPSLNMLLQNPLIVSHHLNSVLASNNLQFTNSIVKPIPTKSMFFDHNSELYKQYMRGKMLEKDSQRSMEEAPKKRNRNSDIFGKKFENVRQSIIRHFKKTMRRLNKRLKPIFNFEDTTGSRNKGEYRAYTKLIKKLYNLTEDLPDLFDAVYYQIKSLGINSEAIFDCGYGDVYKSCNSKYVEEFFSSQEIVQLFYLHHELMMKSDIYFDILNMQENETDLGTFGEFVRGLPFNH